MWMSDHQKLARDLMTSLELSLPPMQASQHSSTNLRGSTRYVKVKDSRDGGY